jgi:hypothetical protein
MANFVYSRQAVPVGETITLEAQFRDAAGNPKDTDATFPTITVADAASAEVLAVTSSNILRSGIGRYRYNFIIPTGFSQGLWNDSWSGAVDGYTLSTTFDFLVNSVGSVEAVGSIVDPGIEIGDLPEVSFSRDETKNINILLRILKARIQNNAFTPSGDPCNVFSDDDLVSFLCASLSEFNSTPTITNYGFDSLLVSTTFSDIISQGSYLIAMSAIATIEAGREFTLNDNGVTINPPPVSSTITSIHSTLLSDYRAKLKEIKRNHRPAPIGMGAGSILVVNPIHKRLRHLRERQII